MGSRFWSFRPWPAGLIAFKPGSRQKHHDRRAWEKKAALLMASRKRRDGEAPETKYVKVHLQVRTISPLYNQVMAPSTNKSTMKSEPSRFTSLESRF